MNLKLHQDAIKQEITQMGPRASSPTTRAQLRRNENKYFLIQVGPNSEQK